MFSNNIYGSCLTSRHKKKYFFFQIFQKSFKIIDIQSIIEKLTFRYS